MAAKPRAVVIVGILAVAIAAVAAYFLYNYLSGQEQRVKEATASEKIVVAAVEIPVGSAINMTQVKTANWPKANMPQGGFLSTDQVVGRLTIQTLLPGEPVTEARLIPKEGTPGVMIYKIPEGHRAMTVSVDQVAGVAGFINPGNMVDVVLTVTPAGAQQSLSKIVLQNVPILAVGQIVEQKEGKPMVVPTVTMDVTPDAAEKLAVASTQGKLQLVLRRVGDKEVTKTAGATVSKVIRGATASDVKEGTKASSAGTKKANVKTEVAEKPAEEATSVDVLRRGQKSTQQFKGKSVVEGTGQ